MRCCLVAILFLLAALAAAEEARPCARPFRSPQATSARPTPSVDSQIVEQGFRTGMQLLATERAARAAMLAELTPAHRELLARIVGRLAVASQPNDDAAAAQLDMALSRSEVQTIANTETLMHDRMLEGFEHFISPFEEGMTPGQRRSFEQLHTVHAHGIGATLSVGVNYVNTDPGHVLLSAALSGLPSSELFGWEEIH